MDKINLEGLSRGEKIRKTRRVNDITQDELAFSTGISVVTIIGLEKNHTIDPKRATLEKIAYALEIDIKELI